LLAWTFYGSENYFGGFGPKNACQAPKPSNPLANDIHLAYELCPAAYTEYSEFKFKHKKAPSPGAFSRRFFVAILRLPLLYAVAFALCRCVAFAVLVFRIKRVGL
jgi:hypothetical protein